MKCIGIDMGEVVVCNPTLDPDPDTLARMQRQMQRSMDAMVREALGLGSGTSAEFDFFLLRVDA